MSLLLQDDPLAHDRADALRHWLASHNVSLDFVEDGRSWPAQVAPIVDLLALPDSEARSRRKGMPILNHLGTNLPWKSVFASILEDAVPGVTT